MCQISRFDLLAAPVASWVRKHYAEPVTSAAGVVNADTPAGVSRSGSDRLKTMKPIKRDCTNM